jgi:membrane protease YdiL (CAAX protease family)
VLPEAPEETEAVTASWPNRPARAERISAVIEVLLCSGYPTQLLLAAALAVAGWAPQDGALSIGYVVALSLLDTPLLLGLILLFLHARGDDPRRVFFGFRPWREEARAGLPLALVALGLAAATLLLIHAFAPWLRTVERNPLQELMRTPADFALFAVVVVIAGGLREELQRAFLLTRFEQSLGGARVGLLVTSLGFGAGHYVQGADAAIATGLLGAFWALVYLRRRSAVAPMVSHAAFNLLQLLQFAIVARGLA